MVVSALDIISVERAKQDLRIPIAVAEEDARIADMIRESVNWVELKTGLPLIDVKERYLLEPPEGPGPVAAPIFNVISLDAFTYWQPDGTPVTITEEADLPVLGDRVLWPPAGGWPIFNANAPAVVDVTREYDFNESPVIRRLAMEFLSRLYDGIEFRPMGGVRTLLEAIPRESARRLKPAQILAKGGSDLPDGTLTWRGGPVTWRGKFVTLRGGQATLQPGV